VTIYVALAALIGLAVAAFLWAALQAARKGAATDQATIADLQKQVAALTGAVAIEKTARDGEKARLEAVVVNLKAEIEILGKDIAACSDPAAVRARLDRLLSLG
jgi:hypothetical protein